MNDKEKQLAQLIDRRLLNVDDDQFAERRKSDQSVTVDLRTSEQPRRQQSDNRRNCRRFSVGGGDPDLVIIREERKILDEDGEVCEIETVDSSYEVNMVDQSAGGFGFEITTDVPLEIGHIIRLATPAGMHLVRVSNIRASETREDILQVGGEFVDNLVADTTEVSVLELFVDRRQSANSSQATAVIVGTLALAWSFVLAYTIFCQI